MNRNGTLSAILLGVVFTLAPLGCGAGDHKDASPNQDGKPDAKKDKDSDDANAQQTTIKLDGSSTVYPIALAVADEFQKAKGNKGVKVTVGVSGTGGGFKKFCVGDTDISDASRPINKKEIETAKTNSIHYIELPIGIDAITVVVHKENDWAAEMTTEELKMMWSKASQGKVTKWSDIREGWPKEEFKLFGPGTDSGTYDYFTEAVNGKSGDSRTDYSASEDDNTLVRGVAGNKYALGYFGYSYYEENKKTLKAVKIKGPNNKEAVEPSDESIKAGTYTPLSRPLFIYMNKKSAEREEVEKFVNFFLNNAATLARRQGAMGLPKTAYPPIKERFKDRKTGTAFGGTPRIGMSIDDLLKLEVK